MSLSLFEICIPNYLQTLNAVSNVLAKGATYAEANGRAVDDLLALSLHETMWPLQQQLVSVMHHSLGAIEGVKRGEFNPPKKMPNTTYTDFQQLIDETAARIGEFSSEEINKLEGHPMKFKAGEREIPFTGENFILSFSLPNFYFHAATTYDLLRREGVELSKMDYLGRLRKG